MRPVVIETHRFFILRDNKNVNKKQKNYMTLNSKKTTKFKSIFLKLKKVYGPPMENFTYYDFRKGRNWRVTKNILHPNFDN